MDAAAYVALAVSVFANIVQAVDKIAARRTSDRAAAAAVNAVEAGTEERADAAAIAHYERYATRLEQEVKRLQERLDASDAREREYIGHAARQDEKIKNLEITVAELRAMYDAAARAATAEK